MISLDVPGWGKRTIEHLVLDFNGTLSKDGKLLPGVDECLALLSIRVRIHICTADTFGTVKEETRQFESALKILAPNMQAQQKVELVRQLGPLQVVAVGNGRNDVLMLQEAAVGIAVIGHEGASAEIINAADIVCCDTKDALELLLEPKRICATLRR